MTRQALVGIAVALLLGAGARDAAAQAAPRAPAPPAAQDEHLPPVVRAGSPDGPVQITFFCDVSDDACARLVVVFAGVLDEYPRQVGVTFHHHAPGEHQSAHLAYRAVLAAARQARGWQMLDLVCANADRLDEAGLLGMAAQLGLDQERFAADAAGREVAGVADADAGEAASLGLDAGPAVVVNGARLAAPYTFDTIGAALRAAVKR